MRTKLRLLGLGLFVLGVCVYLFFQLKKEEHIILVGSVPATVDVASNPFKIAKGLMFKESLENDGMLFIFEETDYHGFWMKNMKIAVDIAFVNENLEIIEIKTMLMDDEIHRPKEKIKYALEVSWGWFEEYDIKVGDLITLPKSLQP